MILEAYQIKCSVDIVDVKTFNYIHRLSNYIYTLKGKKIFLKQDALNIAKHLESTEDIKLFAGKPTKWIYHTITTEPYFRKENL